MTRPGVTQIKRYKWLHHRQETPGIALMSGQRIIAHLTPDEALDLAHGIADVLNGQHQVVHTTRTIN